MCWNFSWSTLAFKKLKDVKFVASLNYGVQYVRILLNWNSFRNTWLTETPARYEQREPPVVWSTKNYYFVNYLSYAPKK